MSTFRSISLLLKVLLFSGMLLIVSEGTAFAQGSISGAVTDAGGTVPTDSAVIFVGYINNTDNEVRITSVDGAGYQNGHWFDDFQNYIGEAAGLPYDYLFYNKTASEFFWLSSTIPTNSFQLEDVQLGTTSFPLPPVILGSTIDDPTHISLNWQIEAGMRYHIFRRSASSNGSFYRVDDISGLLSTGVTNTPYVDSTIVAGQNYNYLIIGLDGSGLMTPPSELITPSVSGSCCTGTTGNIDMDPGNLIDVGDLTRLIDFLFISNRLLDCPEEANADGDAGGVIDVGDLTRLIDYLFISNRSPAPCQ